jgi:hypothetical protein
MSDVERWPEWTPTVTSVEVLDQGPLRVGTRVRIQQPRLPPAVWTVTVLELGRRFTWKTGGSALISVADHRIEPRGTSSMSRVTLTFEWNGWVAPLLRLFFSLGARRYVRIEAESLKRRCEAASR